MEVWSTIFVLFANHVDVDSGSEVLEELSQLFWFDGASWIGEEDIATVESEGHRVGYVRRRG